MVNSIRPSRVEKFHRTQRDGVGIPNEIIIIVRLQVTKRILQKLLKVPTCSLWKTRQSQSFQRCEFHVSDCFVLIDQIHCGSEHAAKAGEVLARSINVKVPHRHEPTQRIKRDPKNPKIGRPTGGYHIDWMFAKIVAHCVRTLPACLPVTSVRHPQQAEKRLSRTMLSCTYSSLKMPAR